MSKRASYRDAVDWIAFNDGDGDDERLDVAHVGEMVTVCCIADVFGKSREAVAADVVRCRNTGGGLRYSKGHKS